MPMSASINKISSDSDIKELISSCRTISASLHKLLPVKLNGYTVMALVDSGNSFCNALSLSVAKRIHLLDYQPYTGSPVGTASVGSSINIVGIVPSFDLHVPDDTGKEHVMPSRLVIVKHLSCGLNISLPFMVEHGLDLIISQGILLKNPKNIRFPLYRNINHARRRLKNNLDEAPQINVVTVGEQSATVSSKMRQTIPPRTGKLIPVHVEETNIQDPTDSVFAFKDSFIRKIKKLHPDQDETYLGLNSLDQVVSVSDSNEIEIYFFNESSHPVTISSNCVISNILIPEHHPSVINMTKVMTVAENPSKPSDWMNNTPSAKLTPSSHEKRREYVRQVLDFYNNPILQKNSRIAGQIIDLIMIFWSVFYRDGNCGGTDVIEHPVYTPKGLPPIRLKNRPVNPGLTDSLKEQIATWLKDGVIRSGGVSPWNFPLLPVRKKNGKWRWVVDFRALNSVTRKDSFPIPNIIELLSYLRKSKIFTSLDLAQAFHSIPVREVDREKLSFCALDKFYEFCRMPFGLTSAPNTWARLVTHVLQEIPKSQLIVFFDDLLIHSPDLETHVDTLKQVFVLLQQAGLRLNMEKTDWVKTKVKFLGHLISDQGVSVPPEFSQIIKDWPLPKTLKDLRAFLGKCNYYRSHFQNFAIIASPLMAHLKGASESSRKLDLEKDPQAIASFEALKQLLMSPQLLAYPDFDSVEPFIVDTDYSHEGLGTVLSQVQDGVERPISFNARRLKPSESQYASHKGELLALIFAIDTYKFFLTGRKFLVRTDNSALSWLKTQKDPKGILMRWLRILSTYDFDIQHRAGTKHGNADSLSRAAHAPFLSETEAQEILADNQILLLGEAPEDDGQESEEEDSLSESDDVDPSVPQRTEFPVPQGPDEETIIEMQKSDTTLSKILAWVKLQHKPTSQEYKLLNPDEKFYVDCFEYLEITPSGLLVRNPIPFTNEKDVRIPLPERLWNKVLASFHGKNHAGGNSLADCVQLKYIFPRLVSFCREYVFKCPRCQRLSNKTAQRHTYGYDLVGSPGEKVCLDFVGPLKPTKKGHTSLLTVVDVYTRWFTAWPVKNQKAETVIKFLIRDYFPDRGVPSVVHSDNGPAFIAHVFQVAMAAFDVRTTTTPVYNPKSNTVERFHRSLKRKLTALIHEFDDEWDEALPATLLAMRTSVNRTTGFTPFYLEHGREARLPVDMIAGPPPVQSEHLDKYTDKIRNQFAKAFSVVAERQNSYIMRQKELYRERQHKINIDDLVWLFTDRANPSLSRKFQSFWSGPYKVVRQLSNTIFEIESYGRWTKNKVITSAAVDRLKKCYITDPDTNLGVPVELTATDVRPYFEDQELLGRLPASEFAPHVFDKEQELPMTLPSPSPRDEVPSVPITEGGPSAPPTSVPATQLPEAPVAVPLPMEPLPESPPEAVTVPKSEPRGDPEVRRGRPPGRKNKPKTCPNCTSSVPCVDHCMQCITGSACEQHTARQRCAKCTRTRSCPAHS